MTVSLTSKHGRTDISREALDVLVSLLEVEISNRIDGGKDLDLSVAVDRFEPRLKDRYDHALLELARAVVQHDENVPTEQESLGDKIISRVPQDSIEHYRLRGDNV